MKIYKKISAHLRILKKFQIVFDHSYQWQKCNSSFDEEIIPAYVIKYLQISKMFN